MGLGYVKYCKVVATSFLRPGHPSGMTPGIGIIVVVQASHQTEDTLPAAEEDQLKEYHKRRNRYLEHPGSLDQHTTLVQGTKHPAPQRPLDGLQFDAI